MRPLLILATMLWTSSCTALTYDHTYHVAPNDSMCTNTTTSCQEFRKYAAIANIYFHSQAEFIFQPGVHILDLGILIQVQSKHNIRLVGSYSFTQHSVAENVNEYGFDPYSDDQYVTYLQSTTIILCTNLSGISFYNVTNLTLANLTVLNCGHYSPVTSQTASIHMSSVYNLLIEGVSVLNSTGYGLFGANIFGESQITRSSFVGNNQFVKNVLQPVSINNCKKEAGHLYTYDESFDNQKYIGGNLYLYYNDSPIPPTSDRLQLSFILVALGIDAFFSYELYNVAGTGFALKMDQSQYSMNITIDNIVAYRNQGVDGANIYINATGSLSSSYVLLANMNSSYATSVSSSVWYSVTELYSWQFSCRHSSFLCNYIYKYGSTLYLNIIPHTLYPAVTQSMSKIENCTFQDSSTTFYIQANPNIAIYMLDCRFLNGFFTIYSNADNSHQCYHLINSSFKSSTVNIYALGKSSNAVLQLRSNTFMQSRIFAQNAYIYLEGKNNTFVDNFVLDNYGGGGAIYLARNCYFVFTSNSEVIFTGNTAINGGAVYISSDSIIEFESPTNVSFINNTAFHAGGAIYFETATSNICSYALNLNCTELEGIHLYFESNYANDAGSVLYGGNIDTCQISSCMYNSTFVFDAITFIGYHDPSTSLISSDAQCISSCNTSTSPECLTYQNISIYPGQIPQLIFVTVGQRNDIVPTLIYFSSKTNNAIFGIIRTLKQCSSYSIPYQYDNGTQELIPDTGSWNYNSYSVQVILLQCPVLFIQNSPSSSCKCDPLLERHNLVCNIGDATIQSTESIWIGLTLQSVQAFYSPCPFDYCMLNNTINVLDLDSQCSYNRSGVLCGRCQGNLSMMFGTSQCASCSNYYLLLIFVFIIMGAVLVGALVMLDFTVTNGALNGIVLYANIIRINDTIFFQRKHGYFQILSTLVAWINLDLGIETCFYDGMNSNAKTWLQIVFPVYIFFLVGGMILAGRYFSWISKLNAVPVLSTLVLLSYSKILRTIINILSYASLDTMNRTTTGSLVWLYDGNVGYLGLEHLPMFICCLLMIFIFIIPYCTLLLLAPCAQARSHWRCLQWVNKLKPFIDTYQAPFKDKYRYWSGILLFIRLPLYLMFILSNSTSLKMLTIMFCAFVYVSIANGISIYKNSSVLVVETIFIANIFVLSATVLASSSDYSLISMQTSEVIIAIGITSAMLLLVVIVIHHRLRKTSCIQLCAQSRRRASTIGVETTPLQAESDINEHRGLKFREPLLDI